MDKAKRKPSSYPGVRVREHKTRKHGVRPDRYFFIRYKVNGKDKEEGVGWASSGMTAEKAARLLGIIRDNLLTGKGPQSLKALREQEEAARQAAEEKLKEKAALEIKFGAFFEEEYLPNTSLRKKEVTVATESTLYNIWIKNTLSDLPLPKLSYTHIEDTLNGVRRAGKSRRTLKYVASVISQVWNYARTKGLVKGDSPTKQYKIEKLDNDRTRYLSSEEAKLLLDALGKHSQELKEIALLGLMCGLRSGEIFKLRWSDIDFRHGAILLRGTKAGNSRYAFFTDAVRGMLEEKAKARPSVDALIFPGPDGRIRQRVSKTFSRVVEELGLNQGIDDPKQKVVFHTLRHTFASWLAANNIPLYNVQKLMGHSEAKMVQRYAHLSIESVKESVNVLNEQLRQETEPDKQAKVIKFGAGA